jgi:hypothetical protein
MDLAGDGGEVEDEDEDEDEDEAGAEAEAKHRGEPKEHTLLSTHHPATMEATSTKSRPTITKATTCKALRVQDGKEDEDKGVIGGGLMREHDERFKNQLKNMDAYINNECIQWYGFISDSKTPPWKNKINALKSIDQEKLELRKPRNLSFHNLSDTKLPTGTNAYWD